LALQIPLENGANTWGWATQVDLDTPDSPYGQNLCGLIEYDILTNDAIPQATDLVDFISANQILFAPQLSDAPGTE